LCGKQAALFFQLHYVVFNYRKILIHQNGSFLLKLIQTTKNKTLRKDLLDQQTRRKQSQNSQIAVLETLTWGRGKSEANLWPKFGQGSNYLALTSPRKSAVVSQT